jgi:phosphoribosyl 1,2-cyclic phosphodiesterase
MRVIFWGTRGNIASPGAHTIELGGNTSCVEVAVAQRTRIILDAGTGLIEYASSIVNRADTAGAKRATYHLVLSHFHWDHVLGFPFFHPIHIPGTTVHIYSGFPAAKLESHVRALFDGTYSPLRNLDNTAAKVLFHQIPRDGIGIGKARVACQLTDHSDESYAIRIDCDEKSVAYVTDHEARLSPINDAVVAFAKGSDLLIHDAQLTESEYAEKVNSGHSTIEAAINNAVAAAAKRLVLTHHAPVHSDDFLRLYLSRYLRRRTFPTGHLVIELAKEGAAIEV